MPDITNDFTALFPPMRAALLAWYAAHGRRDLPWRLAPDPYHVYVSEIMLQQTQVKTVLARYYGPFLQRFPKLAHVADASAQEVLKAWEGLGYYSRALNLHKTARLTQGRLPANPEALQALPGIGRNTAHAIACFGFGDAVPVMEANVKRVLCRLLALSRPDDATLWESARQFLTPGQAFDHNQAMMDLGATLCTPRAPNCLICPLAFACQGKAEPTRYPEKKPAKITPERKKSIIAFRSARGEYYLAPRDSVFLGGLYGFPEYDAMLPVIEWGGKPYALAHAESLGPVTQSYSHFTLDAKLYRIRLAPDTVIAPGYHAYSLTRARLLPLSRADQKILRLLAAAFA